MKLTNLLVIAGLSGAAWFGYQHFVEFDHPLAGTWELDANKSMKQWYRTGVTEGQEKFLKSAFSQESVRTFSKNTETFRYNGQETTSSYTITDLPNNCYELLSRGQYKSKACITDGDLHLTTLPESPERRPEVFVRVEL